MSDSTFTINCYKCSAPNTITTKDFDNNKAFCTNCGHNLNSCDN